MKTDLLKALSIVQRTISLLQDLQNVNTTNLILELEEMKENHLSRIEVDNLLAKRTNEILRYRTALAYIESISNENGVIDRCRNALDAGDVDFSNVYDNSDDSDSLPTIPPAAPLDIDPDAPIPFTVNGACHDFES